jgi:molecular chaperone DnaK (HSP70)
MRINARGIDSGVIDLVVVGEIDEHYLQKLVNRAEDMVKRKIRTLVISRDELEDLKQSLELEKGILLVG